MTVRSEKGAALVVALLVLSALTILGMTSIRSTSMQQTILKNTQLTVTARTSATSEINAQLIDMAGPEPDDIVQIMRDEGLDQIYNVKTSDQPGIGLKSAQTSMSQELTMTLKKDVAGSTPPGFSMSLGSTRVRNLDIEIRSEAELPNTAAKSIQTQGFFYISPSSN